jgi:antirestriction protein ArdC
MSKKVDETVTRMFIEKVAERRAAGENVVAPWRKMWNPLHGADRNLISGKAYRGSNVFMTAVQGFDSPFWATRKQITAAGGTIEKQDDGKNVPYTPIVLWCFPTPEQKAAGRFPFVKFYQVWNIEQTTGLEEMAAAKLEAHDGPALEPIAAAQTLVDGWHGCPPIVEGSARACYDPSRDRISVPSLAGFAAGGGTAEDYYHTLFHEMGHATGHRTRLERDGVVNPVRFRSHDYSEEELIAEMTAGMLAGHTGIDSPEVVENSAAYLDHWLKVLSREPSWLAKAGGQAQKAADLIRGIRWEKAAE